jgi:DNA mismatch repair ATPase MutS
MHKPTAGLEEVFRLYLFVRSIPSLTSSLQSLLDTLVQQHLESGDAQPGDIPEGARIIAEKFVEPLQSIAGKFNLYEQLVEHVVDLQKLPELKVNAVHDSDLKELETEQEGLLSRAERVLQEARSSWANFADVKLEQNTMHGFILRTTRGDDERTLRANYPSVRIISILKNGVHFTTPALERIAERYLSLQAEYDAQQAALVQQAVDTARTYLPVVEAVAALIAEVDVLVAFATAAALSPGVYVRPTVLKRGTGVINLKVNNAICWVVAAFVSITAHINLTHFCLFAGRAAPLRGADGLQPAAVHRQRLRPRARPVQLPDRHRPQHGNPPCSIYWRFVSP